MVTSVQAPASCLFYLFFFSPFFFFLSSFFFPSNLSKLRREKYMKLGLPPKKRFFKVISLIISITSLQDLKGSRQRPSLLVVPLNMAWASAHLLWMCRKIHSILLLLHLLGPWSLERVPTNENATCPEIISISSWIGEPCRLLQTFSWQGACHAISLSSPCRLENSHMPPTSTHQAHWVEGASFLLLP